MLAVSYTVFETKLGWIGLAWRQEGVVRLALPGVDRDATERELLRYVPHSDSARAVPADIAVTIDGIVRYCTGEAIAFAGVPIVFDRVDPLRMAIYAALRRIGHGQTLSYGELADRAGFPGKAREIGQAMGRNPVPLVIPCHRVLAAGGKVGGFSAPGGVPTKRRMLELEGVRLGPPAPAQAAFAF